ncbi:MAG: dihydrofolate reductase family protein [Desulfobacteraceae bacterium]|nr:dihydrofolate reductase family protein [Desulfobacteraceae bacterium]
MKTTLLMATTLDGKIGRNSSHLVDWAGREDRKLFIKLTKDAGVIIMGSNTFDTIGEPLPKRKNIVLTRNKSRIKETLPNALSGDENLIFTDKTPEEIVKDLIAQGFKSVVLIGGSQINSLFLKAKLINKIYVTIVPRFFGTGLSMLSEETDVKLDLIKTQQMPNGHILLIYSVHY